MFRKSKKKIGFLNEFQICIRSVESGNITSMYECLD